MATKSIAVPQRSSLRLTAFFEGDEGEPVIQAAVETITIVGYSTASRETLTLSETLAKETILDTPSKDAAGRPINFRYVTPASALPEPGDYEFVVRVDYGADRVAAEVYPVSVVAAG